jgi:hypothetical protein
MANGDTKDKGKGRRNESSGTTHGVNALAKQFKVGNNKI